MQIILVLLLLICFFEVALSKGMWGSKKQRKEEEAAAAAAAASEALAAASIAKPSTSFGAGGGSRMSDIGSDVRNLIGKYISMAEEFTESKQFDDMVTPQSIEAFMGQLSNANVGAANPQMAAMMSMPQFKDPDFLKQTIKEGIQMAKAYTDEIVKIFEDPAQMDALLQEIPPEARAPVLKLISGDMSGLDDILDTIPGIHSTQKSLLKQLVSGDTEGMMESVKKMFEDEGALEEARQQLIENPDMMDAFGIDTSTVNDKAKFKEYMQNSASAMGGLLQDDTAADISADGRMFTDTGAKGA